MFGTTPGQYAAAGDQSPAAAGPWPGYPARLRLLIFDFDGTLADTWPWFRGQLPGLISRWRLRPLADDEDATLRHLDATAIFHRLGVPGWKLPWIAADLRRRMAADIATIRLFTDVPGVLLRLATPVAGAPPPALALVSSNSRGNVARVLGPGLWSLFATHECGAALAGKAARLRRVTRKLGVTPGAALYIGDELRDIDAARAAGLRVGAVTWGYNAPEVLRRHGPDLVFERVGDLERLRHPA